LSKKVPVSKIVRQNVERGGIGSEGHGEDWSRAGMDRGNQRLFKSGNYVERGMVGCMDLGVSISVE